MKIYCLDVHSQARTQLMDITAEIRQIVKKTGVQEGVCFVYTLHTTAGLTINENADPDVAVDILTSLNKWIPFSDGYRHSEGNSAAHIKSTLTGASLSLFIDGGKLVLGTWQGLYFCEFDGPRTRKVLVKVMEG